jgi:hypothetical protein
MYKTITALIAWKRKNKSSTCTTIRMDGWYVYFRLRFRLRFTLHTQPCLPGEQNTSKINMVLWAMIYHPHYLNHA